MAAEGARTRIVTNRQSEFGEIILLGRPRKEGSATKGIEAILIAVIV